MVNTHVKQLKS